MGMKPYSYVVAGIKTTTKECEASGVDIWSGDFDEGVNEHGIRAITGEDTDDVLIGKVLFESDPYNDTDHAIELSVQPFTEIGLLLALSGIDAELKDIKLYAITVWL